VKLTVNFAASQEIPRIYGTRRFLTVLSSHPNNILDFKWLNYTCRLKRRRWYRLIWSEIVHVKLSES
jgi:hypothetical protein